MGQIKQVLVLRDFGASLYTTAMQQFGQDHLARDYKKFEKNTKIERFNDRLSQDFHEKRGHRRAFLLACAHF